MNEPTTISLRHIGPESTFHGRGSLSSSHWWALCQNTPLIVIGNEPKVFRPPAAITAPSRRRPWTALRVCGLTFSVRHSVACQGTATPTACWESCWARARGRRRRRKSGSSASGRERRSWRNAPAPRRCYLQGASRWPRSNRRRSTPCGRSILSCEYKPFSRAPDMCDMQDSLFNWCHSDQWHHLCRRSTEGLMCLFPV